MMIHPPAEIGMSVADVDTPALLIELEAFERNVRRMAQAVQGSGATLRPHAKTHKSPVIAHRQVALGAVGICCQKVSEAEHMALGGIRDILVSNEIVGRAKVARLAALASQVRISVCVDDVQQVRELSEAACAAHATLEVLVEIDVGAQRCGVAPGAAAVTLAKAVDGAAGLNFAGLQAYQGRAQHTRDYEQRRAQILAAVGMTEQTRQLLRRAGLECRVISGAGTGTYQIEAGSGVFNELQVGSYIFMDGAYAKNCSADGRAVQQFEQSLFLLTTIMSRAVAGRAVVDAGLKALSTDAGMPEVHGPAGACYVRASDEHGLLSLEGPAEALRLGERLRLIPANCDPTVNLHDWYVVVRNGVVEALWPITARGPGY